MQRAEALTAMVAELNAGSEPSTVMSIAIERFAELLGGQRASLFLFEPDGRHLRDSRQAWRKAPHGTLLDLQSLPSSLRAVRAGSPLCVTFPESQREPGTAGRPPKLGRTLLVPLAASGRRIGILYVDFRAGAPELTRDDLEFARCLGHHCALAIDRAQLQERQCSGFAEQLQASEARLAATLDAIGEGVIATDLTGRIALLNPVAEGLVGWHEETALGRPFGEVFRLADESTRRPIEALLEPVLRQEGISRLTGRVSLLCQDGSEHPVAGNGALIRDGAGHALGAVVVFRDVTPERRIAETQAANERLKEANRFKSRFLARVTHELRTPLNVIIGFSQLMADGHTGPLTAAQSEYLTDVLSSSRHLLALIEDILDLTGLEAGGLRFAPEPVDVGALARHVAELHRELAARKQLRCATVVDPALTDVYLDPRRLEQVLHNYLSNAIKFTPDGGTVTLRMLGVDGERLRIEVQDNGPGIAQTDLQSLFLEFQQLGSEAAERAAGTGLGLAVVRHLIEAQGGQVGVCSQEGHGSLFFAELPREARGPEAERSAPAAPVLVHANPQTWGGDNGTQEG